MSEPPNCARGSKTPLVVVPKRVTVRSLPPPTAGTLWHSAQERPLKTGPRPSPTSSASLNSPRPSLNALRCAAVSPRSGSPGLSTGLLAATAATAVTARPMRTEIFVFIHVPLWLHRLYFVHVGGGRIIGSPLTEGKGRGKPNGPSP